MLCNEEEYWHLSDSDAGGFFWWVDAWCFVSQDEGWLPSVITNEAITLAPNGTGSWNARRLRLQVEVRAKRCEVTAIDRWDDRESEIGSKEEGDCESMSEWG